VSLSHCVCGSVLWVSSSVWCCSVCVSLLLSVCVSQCVCLFLFRKRFFIAVLVCADPLPKRVLTNTQSPAHFRFRQPLVQDKPHRIELKLVRITLSLSCHFPFTSFLLFIKTIEVSGLGGPVQIRICLS